MKNGMKLPSIARLRELLKYDPQSGTFNWIVINKKTTRVQPGVRAGGSDGRYRYITLDGCRISEHRAAFAITNGRWPESDQIDHIDGNKLNNRLDNLREVSASMNQQNRHRAQYNNTTGFLGVVSCAWRKSPNKFRAQIWLNGYARNLGYYKTAEEAHIAYVLAKRELHKGCTI